LTGVQGEEEDDSTDTTAQRRFLRLLPASFHQHAGRRRLASFPSYWVRPEDVGWLVEPRWLKNYFRGRGWV
jgi:hypothetical protein